MVALKWQIVDSVDFETREQLKSQICGLSDGTYYLKRLWSRVVIDLEPVAVEVCQDVQEHLYRGLVDIII